ncbi:hypothetical protein LDENG_00124640 [Lucifuga dentata]|nr:hypothetical protein LDENG_00124640 [Lucifuga dentata]
MESFTPSSSVRLRDKARRGLNPAVSGSGRHAELKATHRTLSRCSTDSHLCTHRDKENNFHIIGVVTSVLDRSLNPFV